MKPCIGLQCVALMVHVVIECECICRYWEFVVIARKIFHVGAGLIRDEQVVWIAYFAATSLALALQAKWEPFDYEGSNRVESILLVVQTTTLALGGLFTFELVDTSSPLTALVSCILILINFYKLCPLLNHVKAFREAGKKCPSTVSRVCIPLGDAFVDQEENLLGMQNPVS